MRHGGPLARPLPSYEVKLWPIKKLIPYARNARRHSPAQIERLATLITEFGFRVPALVNFKTGELIAGHGRLKAAAKLGLTEVPCLDGSDMTPAQQRAYRVADNRMAEMSSWDQEILGAELGELKAIGFDVKLTGFEDDDLQKVAVPQGSGVEEIDVTEVQDRFWISIRGPLKSQAKALQALRRATKGIEGVEVELGTLNEF